MIKNNIFMAAILGLVLILIFFVCKHLAVACDINFLVFYSQMSVLILMILALILAFMQINEVKKSEQGKVSTAILSLIEEMEYNKTLLDEYIDHSEKGANVTPKEGKISWEWNKPRQGAYERYLIVACKGNLDLAKEITKLYDKLESCSIIIETIQHFVAVNMIEMKCITSGEDTFKKEIGKHNNQLYDISKEAKILINNLIIQLCQNIRSGTLVNLAGKKYCDLWSQKLIMPIITGLSVALLWHGFNVIKPWNIHLCLPYAYEYKYMGATYNDSHKKIVANIPIKINVDKDNVGILRLGIQNNNIRTLKRVRIHLYFPDGVEILSCDGWKPWEINKIYFNISIYDINNGIALSLDPVTIKFNERKTYKIIYTISGEDIKYIRGNFLVQTIQ